MRDASADRARLTIVDVVNVSVSIAVLAFLGIAFYDVLAESSELPTGFELLMQATIPGTLVALLIVIYTTAVRGRTR